MLLLIEHDTIMSTPQARQHLADFVAARPALNVAIFHSAKLAPNKVRAAYPASLRDRLVLTPGTPREKNLAYSLMYEVCCVTSALKFVGKMGKDDSWLCVVPPEWDYPLTHRFGAARVVVIDGAFSPADARLLSDLDQCAAPRNRPSNASASSIASFSGSVKISMRGKSSGQGTRSASLCH